MRIAFFNYHYDIDGTARGAAAQLRSMAHALERRGHEVELVFRTAGGKTAGHAPGRPAGLKSHSILRRFGHVPKLVFRNIPFYMEECRLIEQIRPDIVLAVHQYCNISPLLAARKKGIPCVLFIETPMVYEYSLFYRDYHPYSLIGGNMEGFCVKHADEVICISEILKGFLTAYGVSARKIHVIPNGVDENLFNPRPVDALLVERLELEGKRVVGFVGTFQFFSDIPWFLDVMESVCKRMRDVVFLFVGSGKPASMIQQEAGRRGMTGCLRFAGPAEHLEVPKYLSVMDVTICPYRGDYLFYGSALKPLEYMASGKALVAPALGQIKELVHDGFNGMLHAWDDDRSMGEAIIRLLEDSELRAYLGHNARRTIEQGWTWEIQTTRMDLVLQRAASRRR